MLALLFSVPSLAVGMKIVLIWLVALAASATSAHLIARAVRSLERGSEAEKEPYD